MSFATVLQLLDDLVLSKTGENLSHIQKTIIKGSLEGKTYSDIAHESYLTEGHIGDKGSELWKLLSEVLGVDIHKPTARGILENIQFSNISSEGDFLALNNLHICTDHPNSKEANSPPEIIPTQPYLDLGTAPEILRFYGRIEELNTLEKWIVGDRCRLITLLGLKGSGKTALSIQLIQQIKHHFDYIIYRSLYFSPPLDKLLTKLLQIFPKSAKIPEDTEDKISCILNYFRQYRCLVILDDWYQIFKPEHLAGRYKNGYEDYHLFLEKVGQKNHQSILLLNSQETSSEIAVLTKTNPFIRSLTLSSLGNSAKEILKDYQLLDVDKWDILIENYQGNPEWLQIIAVMIQEFFRGSFTQFLAMNPLILTESLKNIFDKKFQRLTQSEKELIFLIAQESNPIYLTKLLDKQSVSIPDLLMVIDSLKRRILLELKPKNQETILFINPLLKEYINQL
ncbi:NB-ARC domain-containing protein [Dapis sp. BLCC M172]|uniref:NB-ARC domain-containing protein n=1 Tax=Dapis sp. BLCC M172 TaxID=2975281 RepID=UPI003CF87B43